MIQNGSYMTITDHQTKMILCKASDFSRCLAEEHVGEPASWLPQLVGLMKSYGPEGHDRSGCWPSIPPVQRFTEWYTMIYHDIYHYIYLYIYIIIPLWIPLVIQHNYGKIPMSKSSHRAQCRCHSWASKQVMKTNMRTDGFTAGCWCAKEHERRLSKKFTACFLVGVFADISTCVNRISIKKYRSLR